ncbi:hypothetical protein HK405_004264 [Cladochytrium tenue]|nr:hypothetical protein HK405_004264 [Cladochytrium tenue]
MSVLFESPDALQFQPYSYGDPSRNSFQGSAQSFPTPPQYGASFNPTISWAAALSTGDYPDEPPLLEELGINFSHIKGKALAVLNPFGFIDKNIMDDADLAGPIIFCFLFGGFLLLAGKLHFGYIYGIATLGCLSMYAILNLMSESGIDGYRTASVLGYCLLPMVILSFLSMLVWNKILVMVLSSLSVLWCTYSASLMFVTVLSMSEQRMLVAYPVALLYSAFALLAVFE